MSVNEKPPVGRSSCAGVHQRRRYVHQSASRGPDQQHQWQLSMQSQVVLGLWDAPKRGGASREGGVGGGRWLLVVVAHPESTSQSKLN